MKVGIFEARERCKELGSTIFLPKSFSELKSLNQLGWVLFNILLLDGQLLILAKAKPI